MEWNEYVTAQLHRMLARLESQARFHREALNWFRKYGFAGHPLATEAQRSLRQVECNIEAVRAGLQEYAPHRPLMGPWRSSGLSAKLRADFEVRGIDERDK